MRKYTLVLYLPFYIILLPPSLLVAHANKTFKTDPITYKILYYNLK
jgi:hypothetical protein